MKAIILISLVFLAACATEDTMVGDAMVEDAMEETMEETMEEEAMEVKEEVMEEAVEEEMEEEAMMAGDWKDIELYDIMMMKNYKISDFDKPVLLESFAVWCPTCKKQQDVIKDLHEDIGDSAVSISLDTDPNEDEQQVIDHFNKHHYDWIFSISPTDLTQALIDEFGISVVNAPGAPIVLICPNGESTFLERGVKSIDELKNAIAGC